MALERVANSVFFRETLEDFPETAFLKFMLRNPTVERRYYAGELRPQLFEQLYATVGGTPRFLEQVRKVLETANSAELQKELSQRKPGRVREQLDRYCEQIFASRLFSYLGEESKRALSRSAIYSVAVNLEGLSAVTGQDVSRLADLTREWREYALAYPEAQTRSRELWTVYGVLRGWLLADQRIATQERKSAAKAGADYLFKVEREDREGELGLSTLECLQEARTLYLSADDIEKAMEVTDRISGQLVRAGLYREVIRLNEEMVEREKGSGPMTWIARAHLDQADYSNARHWYQQGLAAAKNNLRETAKALHGLASVDMATGDYASAREQLEQSLLIRRQIGDRAGEAGSLHQLASIDMATGDYAFAREQFEQSLLIKRQIGDRAGEAVGLHQLASIDIETGDYASAREQLEQSLLIRRQIGDRAGEAGSLHQLASIDIETGDYASARERLEQSLLILRQIGDRAGEAVGLHQLASIDIQTGDYASARERLEQSLLIKRQIGDRAGEAGSLHQLATIDIRTGDYASARERLEQSLLIKRQIGDRAGEAVGLHQLATIDMATGDYASAREQFEQSLLIRQQVGDRAGEAAVFFQLGRLAPAMNNSANGVRLLAVCYLLDNSIGHGDTQSDLEALTQAAAASEMTPTDVQDMLAEVGAAYEADRGWGLIKASFEGVPGTI